MPRIRISEFHGEIPRLNRRALPVGGAQKARNCRFDSGDLRPVLQPLTESILPTGDIGNLFWYRHQDDDDGRYIAFGDSFLVHGFRTPEPEDDFRRWYWNLSGDSMRYIANPKNPSPAGAAAAVGAGDEFQQFRGVRVGIPAPKRAPVAVDATPESAIGTGTSVQIATVARTNPMTVNTSGPHGIESGWRVRIVIDESLPRPQDTGGDGDGVPPPEGEPPEPVSTIGQIWALDGAEGVAGDVTDNQFDIVGVSATGFSEFDQEDLDALRIERVVRDSEKQSRTYIWTYVSQYGEEGPPSKPSNIITVPEEGATVRIDLGDGEHNPTVDGGEREYINRIRLYRSVAGNAGVLYLFVGEMQFSGGALPDDNIGVNSWANDSFGFNQLVFLGESIVDDQYAEGDSVVVRSSEDEDFEVAFTITDFGNFDGSGNPSLVVTDLPNGTVDPLTTPGGMYMTKGLGVVVDESVGWLQAPSAASPDQAWTGQVVETVNPISLGEAIKSTGFFPPPNKMTGIALLANGVIAGWRGNTVYFTDRYRPHAWDPDYRVTIEDEIVGGHSYGNTLVLGTKTRPYIVTGSDPSAMIPKKLELHAPLLDSRSIIDAGIGVMYTSRDGLVLVSSGGAQYVTESHFSEREWLEFTQGRDRIAFYDRMAMIFGRGRRPLLLDMRTDKIEVSQVEIDISAAAEKEGELAIVSVLPAASQYRTIELFKSGSQPFTAAWQSGLVTFRRPVNVAAAQVFADGYPLQIKLRYIRPSSYPAPVAGEPDLEVFAEKTYIVTGPEPFWLESGYLTREFEMEVHTQHRVQEVNVATSIEEIRRP